MPIVASHPWIVGDLYQYQNNIFAITKVVNGQPFLRVLATRRAAYPTIDFLRKAVRLPYRCAYSRKHKAKSKAAYLAFQQNYPELFI